MVAMNLAFWVFDTPWLNPNQKIYEQTYFAGCPVVTVKLQNGARDALPEFAGKYIVSSIINGRPSYEMGDQALWFHGNRAGIQIWIIGETRNLGSYKGGIYTEVKFGGIADKRNVWKYYADGWETAKTNDIIVQCTSGTFQVLNFNTPDLNFSFVNKDLIPYFRL